MIDDTLKITLEQYQVSYTNELLEIIQIWKEQSAKPKSPDLDI